MQGDASTSTIAAMRSTGVFLVVAATVGIASTGCKKSAGNEVSPTSSASAQATAPATPTWTLSVVAKGLKRPSHVQFDDTNAFVVVKAGDGADSDYELFRVPRTGGAPVSLAKQKYDHALVLDGDRLIWVADDSLSIPKLGGDASKLLKTYSHTLGVDDASIYGAIGDKGDRMSAVAASPKTGGQHRVLVGGIKDLSAVVSDDTHVYWSTNPSFGSEASISRLPKTGGSPQTLVTGLHGVWHMVLDDADVFFIDRETSIGGGLEGSPHALYRVAKTGGEKAKVIAFKPGREITGLAVDHAFAYWSAESTDKTKADGGVYAVSKTGGAPIVIGANQASARNVVARAGTVAWSAFGTCDPEPNRAGCLIGYHNDGSVVIATLVGGIPPAVPPRSAGPSTPATPPTTLPSPTTSTVTQPSSADDPIELAPDDRSYSDARGGWGWGERCYKHLLAGRLGWARAACDKAMEMNPAEPQPKASLLYNLGMIEQRKGRNDAAREFFKKSLALRPNKEVQGALDKLDQAP